jgi:predicted histone-like DNA-binding protein
MPVKYVLLEKGNPSNPEETKKWYAISKSTGDVSLKALGKAITQRSKVNHANTKAVLRALTQVLTEQLSDGKIVRIGNFGSFQTGIGSEGVETSEKFTTALIKSRKIAFRPGSGLKEMLNNLTFEKQS